MSFKMELYFLTRRCVASPPSSSTMFGCHDSALMHLSMHHLRVSLKTCVKLREPRDSFWHRRAKSRTAIFVLVPTKLALKGSRHAGRRKRRRPNKGKCSPTFSIDLCTKKERTSSFIFSFTVHFSPRYYLDIRLSHQKSSSLSPLHAKTGMLFSASAAATSFCVE